MGEHELWEAIRELRRSIGECRDLCQRMMGIIIIILLSSLGENAQTMLESGIGLSLWGDGEEVVIIREK